jgi:UDP-N-acetylmuramoylalanine--D-glutamate ligase
MRNRKREALKGKKVTVIGLSRSGQAVAQLLRDAGVKVFGSDIKSPPGIESLKGIEIETGGHTQKALAGTELIVLSPGVPLSLPFLWSARERGIEILSEVEVAWWFARAPIWAVTGSNGKSTTASLLGHILKSSGREVEVAGNIGRPLSGVVKGVSDKGIIVAEISSFQLDTVRDFSPKLAILLNITPDHLDRHPTFEHYVQSKRRIFANQRKGDLAILNQDDPLVSPLVKTVKATAVSFSTRGVVNFGVGVEGGWVVSSLWGQVQRVINVEKLPLPGPHNLSNYLATVAACLAGGLKKEEIVPSLSSFKGLEHRLEMVDIIKGVRFVNDSKGTNVDATKYALLSFPPPLILIAGGRDKGSDFSSLVRLIEERVKEIILLGESKEMLADIWNGLASITKVETLSQAVRRSYEFAKPGETVLFSPACASFDMFTDFEERGRAFKEEVRKLRGLNG